MSEYNSNTSTFKGNAVIGITDGEQRVITFGIKKAKAILSQVDAIKKFIEANDKSIPEEQESTKE